MKDYSNAPPDYTRQPWRFWTAPGKMTCEEYRQRAVEQGFINADGTPVGGEAGMKDRAYAMLMDAKAQGLSYQHLDKTFGLHIGTVLHWLLNNLTAEQRANVLAPVPKKTKI